MSFLERAWHRRAAWLYLLWPLSLVFRIVSGWRRRYQQSRAAAVPQEVPVVIIGNISVGGTGKTPLLIALARSLQEQGCRPGIISRGYGSQAKDFPLTVTAETPVAEAGDEPALIASKGPWPVVIDPDRVGALQALTRDFEVDVVLSDDGLQHYRLPRAMEIVLIDGQRLFGNGLCLPAGPLREPVQRLREVDALVVNGEVVNGEAPANGLLEGAYTVHLQATVLRNLHTGERRPFGGAPFKMGDTVQAVAAIGNPQRFFAMLETLPYSLECFAFPDHYQFTREELEGRGVDLGKPIVMTEKDAIKCADIADANWWVLETEVAAPEALLEKITALSRQWQNR